MLKCVECGTEFPYREYLPVGDWYMCKKCLKEKIDLGEIPKIERRVFGIIRLDGQLLCFAPDTMALVQCFKWDSALEGYVHDKWKEKEYLEMGLTQEEMDRLCLAVPYSEITKIGLKKKWVLKSFVKLAMTTTIKLPHKVLTITTKKLPDGAYSYEGWTRGLLFDIEGHYYVEKKKPKVEDYENILRPIFGDKLSV